MKEILEQRGMTAFASGLALAIGVLLMFSGALMGAGFCFVISALLWQELK